MCVNVSIHMQLAKACRTCKVCSMLMEIPDLCNTHTHTHTHTLRRQQEAHARKRCRNKRPGCSVNVHMIRIKGSPRASLTCRAACNSDASTYPLLSASALENISSKAANGKVLVTFPQIYTFGSENNTSHNQVLPVSYTPGYDVMRSRQNANSLVGCTAAKVQPRRFEGDPLMDTHASP
jgi:hypothetical protein